MLERLQRSMGVVAVALMCCTAASAAAFWTATTGDYVAAGPVAGDNAGPSVSALAHADLIGLVTHQPSMGLVSILVRAPFVAAASSLGSGSSFAYRVGALACLLPLGIFAAWIIVRERPERVGLLAGVLAAAVLLLSPAVVDAVEAGHPEGVLRGVLASAAVIAAIRGRAGWAAVMLGLTIGTKPYGVIAVPSVLIALPGQRRRTAIVAGVVAAATTLAVPLADPGAFARALHVEGLTHIVNAFSLWWPLGSPFHLASGIPAPGHRLPLGLTRKTASMVGLLVIVPPLALYWARAHRRGAACDALALLALLGAVRCICDTTALEYYYLAVLIPLASWEAVGLGRAPFVTVLATLAVLLFPGGWLSGPPALINTAWVALSVALVVYLARRAFGAEPARRLSSRAARAWQLRVLPRAGWGR